MIEMWMIGPLLGLSKTTSPEDVIRAIARAEHGAPSERKENIVSSWQSANEFMAIGEYSDTTGNHLTPRGPVQYGHMIDYDAHTIGDDGIVEVYCPFSKRNDREPVFDKAIDQPARYAKMQIRMLVRGASYADFVQWTPFNLSIERVECDRSYIDGVLHDIEAFAVRAASDVDNPDHLDDARVTIDTPRAKAMLAEYRELQDAMDRAKERKDELLAEIVTAAKGRNAVFAGAKLTKVERKGSIKYSEAVKFLAPGANLEPWRGEASSSWSLK